MSTGRWHRLQQLFLGARALPAERRTQWLLEQCADDAELRAEVQALLEADSGRGVLDAALPGRQSVSTLLPDEPQRVGAFRIVRELGRGGMGVVYLGERADGQFDQQVAIKLVDSGAAELATQQRFLAERRILATLRHPNIARLIDGGITADERPYLVMEYVDGRPVTEFCDAHRMTVAERLQLFVDICAAVEHAHARLIIHRDLKPANILVDADGRVHLLDFGIARLLDATDGGAAPVTRLDLRAMTPEYASPEQVRGETLSTATDVYSLGVLLYELLCGTRPYTLNTGSPAEAIHAVCTQDPPRPSVRAAAGVDDAAEARDRAAARSSTPERLARELAGDLDSIVMMALRKEPGLRYTYVNALRDDIERYMHGRPVRARRGTTRYRAGKFARRHRTAVAAATLAVMALAIGISAALWQASVAGRERDRAADALAESEELSSFLMELFRTGEQDDGDRAGDVTAADLLRRGIARADELADRPLLQARLLDVIGRMTLDLGDNDEARRLLGRAVALQRAAGPAGALELSGSLLQLGRVLAARGAPDSALSHVNEALAIRRAHLPPAHPDIAAGLQQLASLHAGPQQEQLYREALAILQRSDQFVEEQVLLLQALATNQRRQGRLPEAVATDRDALRLAERTFGPDDHRTGQAMIHLADQIADLEGDRDAALALLERGVALLEQRFGPASLRLMHGLHSLGRLHAEAGRHDEAERLFRRTLAIRVASTGAAHPAVAEQKRLLALQLTRQGDLQEAEALITEVVQYWRNREGNWRPLARAVHVLADIQHLSGRYTDADSSYAEVIALYGDSGVFAAEARRQYGRVLLQQQRWADAERELLHALSLLEQAYASNDHPNVLESRRALVELYQLSGRPHHAASYQTPPGRYVAY